MKSAELRAREAALAKILTADDVDAAKQETYRAAALARWDGKSEVEREWWVRKIRASAGLKRCRICSEKLDKTKNGGNYCAACRPLILKLAKYALTAKQVHSLFQGKPSCYVCGGDHRLGVDHDHRSGTVRGVLCSRCNFFVACLERLPKQAIDKAMQYVAGSNLQMTPEGRRPPHRQRLFLEAQREAIARKVYDSAPAD